MSIQQNTALFSLLGTLYGGNGQTTFNLPDLRGRTPIHRSATYQQGEMDGLEDVVITIATMAAHNHPYDGSSAPGNTRAPSSQGVGHTMATGSGSTNYYTTDANPLAINPQAIVNAGGNQAHPNMQPYLVLNYCIALAGVYPSRN